MARECKDCGWEACCHYCESCQVCDGEIVGKEHD